MISRGTPTDHFIENPYFMHHRIGEHWLNSLMIPHYGEWLNWWRAWERGRDIPVNSEFTEGLSWHPKPVKLLTSTTVRKIKAEKHRKGSRTHRTTAPKPSFNTYGGEWNKVKNHKEAIATPEFTTQWWTDKEKMKAAGYRCYKDGDTWMMSYYSNLVKPNSQVSYVL